MNIEILLMILLLTCGCIACFIGGFVVNYRVKLGIVLLTTGTTMINVSVNGLQPLLGW